MAEVFKVKELWFTRDNYIAKIIQTWDVDPRDQTVGKAEIYTVGHIAFGDRLYSSKFTVDYLVKKITKEDHPEYFL